MKTKWNNAGLFLSVFAALCVVAVRGRAQMEALGKAPAFTSVEYYERPHAQQIKSRLSGAEATPQGPLLMIKQLKLETFAVDGKPEIVVTAPDCVYDTQNHAASSPGRMQLQSGDGKYRVEGEGFLWRQDGSSLIISNKVQTVIENAGETKTVL